MAKLSTVLSAVDRTERAAREWPRFMTARVAADYADTSPWTIRRNVAPCGRRGRSFVYAIETVETWMRGTALADRAPLVIGAIARPVGPSSSESVARVRDLRRSSDGESTQRLESVDGDMAA